MEVVSRLQQRPEIQLAIGQLQAHEQTHVQICLRVMAPRLQVPCVAVSSKIAEITLAPVDDQEQGQARLYSQHGERILERPLRIVPMADALTELIEELLNNEPNVVLNALPQRRASDGVPPLQGAADSAETAQTQPRLLLQAMFDRAHRTPTKLRTASGVELLIDPHYYCAWLDRPLEEISRTIADELVVATETLGLGTFQERISDSQSGLHPISVEQLCWLGSGQSGAATPLDRWINATDVKLRLQTWPNLSAQPDYAQWLQVLPALWHGTLSMEDAIKRLQATGMSAARARYGMALICLFRHAKQDADAVPTAPMAASLAAAEAVAAAQIKPRKEEQTGLLGRLKARLRSMLG